MEPYVVFIKERDNGKVVLTEKELRSIIQQAYSRGYADGNHWYWPYYYSTTTTPCTITNDRTISYGNITSTNTVLNQDVNDIFHNIPRDLDIKFEDKEE